MKKLGRWWAGFWVSTAITSSQLAWTEASWADSPGADPMYFHRVVLEHCYSGKWQFRKCVKTIGRALFDTPCKKH